MHGSIDPEELDAINRQSDIEQPKINPLEALTRIVKVVPESQMQDSAMQIVEYMLETDSYINTFVKLDNLIAILEKSKEMVKESALGDLKSKKDVILGAKVEARNLPAKWDYHDDATLALNLSIQKAATEAVKARQKMLQSLTAEMADTETGEIVKPATKISQGETLAVSYK